MKNLLLIFLFLTFHVSIFSQEIIELDSYGSDKYVGTHVDLLTKREINGGTVFHISYEGNWDNDMKGAFEYACKIWEETLPNCLPINIIAKIGTIRGTSSNKPLSKVGYITYNEKFDYDESILSSRVKGTVMKEFTYGFPRQFVDSIFDMSFFEKPDIILTYNRDRLNDFCFSIDSVPVDKFDFVTLVLRDIAKALGFSSNITANTDKKKINFTGKKSTPFEKIIFKELGNDSFSAYEKATKGRLDVNIPEMGACSLYAPTTWKNGYSLNAFIPNSNVKITELLTYDFGRGMVLRDIADAKYPKIFEKFLCWDDRSLLTGVNSNKVKEVGNTTNLIHYQGATSIPLPSFLNQSMNIDENTRVIQTKNMSDSLFDYLAPYGICQGDNTGFQGWQIAVLKKDGTWDVIYENDDYHETNLHVCVNDFLFHCSSSEYARSCDGYLRCRVVFRVQNFDNLYHKSYYQVNVAYYVLDYLPQEPELNYAGIVSVNETQTIANDYTDDVKICMKNLEGTERIIVEQLDEGNDMPTIYEIKDFKKGFFVPTVDKELYTEFKVIAVNKNGQTQSETIEVPPTSPMYSNVDVCISDNTIELKNVSKRMKKIPYEIYTVTDYISRNIISKVTSNCTIDISNLAKGKYILILKDAKNKKRRSISFLKK